jgi:glycosyltransferase involved in cell wall biosynthesis
VSDATASDRVKWTPDLAGIGTQRKPITDPTWHNLIVAYSCRLGLAAGLHEPRIGEPHFSLHLSAQRFLAAFSALNVNTLRILRPEIYSSDLSRKFLADPDQHIIHLAVGDFSSLRLLKPAYNIAYVAWEYDSISCAVQDGDTLWRNQFWVLSLFDELWIGSLFGKQVLEKHGLENVHIVPAPVPDCSEEGDQKIEEIIGLLPCAPLLFDFSMPQDYNEDMVADSTEQFSSFFYRSAVRGRPTIYLTIINPADSRKNVEASILAFARFAEDRTNALLIVKLVGPPDIPLHQKLWRTVRLQVSRLIGDGILKSDAVLFVDGFLEETKLMQAVAAADFYISTSAAEGLNLPVLEAMSRGTIVISPIHTAMADYLTPENCIPSACRAVEVDGEMVTGYPIGPVTRHEASISDVYQALVRSASISPGDLEKKREQARVAVLGKYDVTGVAGTIRTRLQNIMVRPR